MKWLECLRAKTAIPAGEALTKLTNVSVAGAVSRSTGVATVDLPADTPVRIAPECYRGPTTYLSLKRCPATASSCPEFDRAGELIATSNLVNLRVAYQRVWYDFNVPTGTYTPAQLRRAGKVAKPWGTEQHYILRLAPSEAGPLNPPIMSATMSCCVPQRVRSAEPTDDALITLTKERSWPHEGDADMRGNIQGTSD
jgi:hypothetical protein